MAPTRSAAVRTRAQQRRAATEQAILDATESLLEEQPFWDLTVEDVMTAAGLGRTAFYRYFHDLETVVVRLMAELVDELRAASQGWLASKDPEGQLHESLLQFAVVYRAHGRLMQAFYDAAGSNVNLKQLWGETISTLIGPVEAHLAELMVDGRVAMEFPIETVRALSVLTDRYLLDVYWAHDQVEPERPTAVLYQIWTRALGLG